MNILLIEDNELNRDMLTRRLERKNYTVMCAKDGKNGLDMAQTNKLDIILLEKEGREKNNSDTSYYNTDDDLPG